MQLSLAEGIELGDIQERYIAVQTLWGLSDLQKSLTIRFPNHSLTNDVRSRLTDFLKEYCETIGKRQVNKHLVSSGLFESEDEIDAIRKGDYSQVSDDETLTISDVPVIGLVGLISAGKTTVGTMAKQEYGTRHFPFIDGLFAFAYAMGREPTKSNRAALREVNDIIKPLLGDDRFARTVLHRARRLQELDPVPGITCDGFRSKREAQLVLEQPNGHLIALDVNLKERYWRSQHKVHRAQRPKTLEQFKADSELEEKTMMRPALELVKELHINNNRRGKQFLRIEVRKHLGPILLAK